MKLNKFLLYLLIVPALSLVSCSDYEDTEVTSPQADENALGANFTAATTSIVVHPDEDTYQLTLNRVNTKEAVSVPVTVKSCSEIDGVKFTAVPTEFLFAKGESKATVELKLSDKCKFQEVYKLTLSLGEGKDHPYASGTSSTVVSVSKDYAWVKIDQPVVLEAGWYDGGILAPLEFASDYEDEDGNQLFRIKALYSAAGTASTATGHLQFLLDENYDVVSMLSVGDAYNPEKINTGVVDKTTKAPYYMNVKSAEKTSEGAYVFTYDVFYYENNVAKNKVEGATATLDYDIAGAMEE